MKRFFSKNKQSKAREDTLEQIRKTRKKLMKRHPELLNHIQKLYLDKQRAQELQNIPADEQEIPMDRNKTIETVIKFLELSESEDMNKKIRTVLSGNLH